MKLLVSGTTRTMARLLVTHSARLGVLLTPANGNSFWWPEGTTWACDNGCFGGLDLPAWLRFLAKLTGRKPSWVAAPDVVANMSGTWRQFFKWQPIMEDAGLPVALVLQDGIDAINGCAPIGAVWDDIAAVFVGGSTEFKLSDTALRLSLEAHERGKLVHFGRVNSLKRILWLARACRDGRGWCDTIDGGSAARWGDVNIPKLVRFIERGLADRQLVAFGGNV